MDITTLGMLAVSQAGHDKNKIYVIIKEEDEYVYLADGRSRPADRPKKKNRKHIQIIRKVQIKTSDDGYQDLEIKRIIKKYQEEANVKS